MILRTKQRSRRKTRHDRGYTAVEILSAMTLFAIGAAGVISMQKVTVQGVADARRYDIATNIAHEWVERLQRDALFWNVPNAANPTTVTGPGSIATTKWLSTIGACSANFCTATIPATGNEGGMSPAFDINGRDRFSGSNDHYFCAQYRLRWVADPNNGLCAGGGTTCATALMEADVRVFWYRLEYGQIGDCGAAGLDPTATPEKFHMLWVPTLIRENASQ